jgi:membrane-associated phospholipid phosphatase
MPSPDIFFPPAPRPTHRRASAITAIFALALILACFLGLDRWVYTHISLISNTPSPTDQDFYHRTHWLWDAVRLFSGLSGGIAAGALIALIHPRGWRITLLTTIAVLATDITGMLLQGGIGRLRPNHTDPGDPYSHLHFTHPALALSRDTAACFPSGEATAAFALASALALLWPRSTILWYTIASLCAAERILHGAHYLSDVTAGSLLGVCLTSWLFARLLQLTPWQAHAVPETTRPSGPAHPCDPPAASSPAASSPA